MVNVPFSSEPFVAGFLGLVLDITLRHKDSATRRDRGMHWWDRFRSFKTDTRSEEFYSLPFNLNKFFPSVWVCRMVGTLAGDALQWWSDVFTALYISHLHLLVTLLRTYIIWIYMIMLSRLISLLKKMINLGFIFFLKQISFEPSINEKYLHTPRA